MLLVKRAGCDPWGPHRGAGWLRGLLACALFAFATPASAQELTFSVGNLSLEQVVTAGEQNPFVAQGPFGSSGSAPQMGATSFIAQQGNGNNAFTMTSQSPGSAIASLQNGNGNDAIGVIVDSPGSAIAQAQLGNNNDSLVGIIGGANNAVSTVQVGNGLGASVALVNSESTTVVYGQAGQNYTGGIVIKNAPPGTVVRLN